MLTKNLLQNASCMTQRDFFAAQLERSSLQACDSLLSMIADVDTASVLDVSQDRVVLHGYWSGVSVCIKIGIVNAMQAPTSHEPLVEAQLCTQLSHPCVLQTFAGRQATVTQWDMDMRVGMEITQSRAIDMIAEQRDVGNAMPTCWPGYNSDMGFGPPLSYKLIHDQARANMRLSIQKPAAPRFTIAPSFRMPTTILAAAVLRLLRPAVGHKLVMMISEYADLGPLSQAIHVHGVFKVPDAKSQKAARLACRAMLRTGCEIAVGLRYLHATGLVHGDVKPDNVVLFSGRQDRRGFTVKITDLGLARRIHTPGTSTVSAPEARATTEPAALPPPAAAAAAAAAQQQFICGTVQYMAPELVSGGTASPASDVYALGVTLWEMCHGVRPYEGVAKDEVAAHVAHHGFTLPWSSSLPCEGIRDLVAACTQVEPQSRPNTEHIILKLQQLEQSLRKPHSGSENESIQMLNSLARPWSGDGNAAVGHTAGLATPAASNPVAQGIATHCAPAAQQQQQAGGQPQPQLGLRTRSQPQVVLDSQGAQQIRLGTTAVLTPGPHVIRLQQSRDAKILHLPSGQVVQINQALGQVIPLQQQQQGVQAGGGVPGTTITGVSPQWPVPMMPPPNRHIGTTATARMNASSAVVASAAAAAAATAGDLGRGSNASLMMMMMGYPPATANTSIAHQQQQDSAFQVPMPQAALPATPVHDMPGPGAGPGPDQHKSEQGRQQAAAAMASSAPLEGQASSSRCEGPTPAQAGVGTYTHLMQGRLDLLKRKSDILCRLPPMISPTRLLQHQGATQCTSEA